MLRPSLLASALVLLVPASASAVTTYRASVSGTYTASGTVSNPTCYEIQPGPVATDDDPFPRDEGGRMVRRTMTGEARETVRFRTTRSSSIYVQRRSDLPAIALTDDDRPVKATATVQRSSTLDDPDLPRGCKGEPQTQDCGRRTLRFDIGFGSSPAGIVPDLNKNELGRKALFDACATTVGMPGLAGSANQVPARVSARRLLHGGRLVLHVRKEGSVPLTASDASGGGRYDLRMVITLTPIRRG